MTARSRPMEASQTLADALAYQRHGFSVLPVRIGAKHPLVSWTRWQQVAPDAEQLMRLWRRRPRANVALVTGRVSGVVVLDIDPRHGGDDSLAELERAHGDMPRLAVVSTPSGGWHVYLRHPGGKVATVAGRLGPGLDIRGDVASPCCHPPAAITASTAGRSAAPRSSRPCPRG